MNVEQPRYRSDVKGNVKAALTDFEDSVRNEVAHSDDFIFAVEDTRAYDEWKDCLTLAEMKAAFKRAMRRPS